MKTNVVLAMTAAALSSLLATCAADVQSSAEIEQGSNPSQEKQGVGAESQLNVTSLPKAEIISVEATTWKAVAADCATDMPPENEDARGRMMALKTDEGTQRIFLVNGRSISCKEEPVKESQSRKATFDATLKPVVNQARQDLAERLAVELGEIEVADAEWVTWRDSSAGCPQDGMVYMQVLTPGARIRLTVSGIDYTYHQVGRAAPFPCEQPSSIEPLPGPATS